ncbi:MAG TPA: hypothetical protein VFM18_18790 [Methanosarcina sp.]|nr:hypothetical protein [Methanosarcina sp.]
MKKFRLMQKHINLREKAWDVKIGFFGRLSGYVQMGLFISSADIAGANVGLKRIISSKQY